MARSSQVWAGHSWCAAAISSPLLAGSTEQSPCSQGVPWACQALPCPLLSERVILAKEEGEKGNKMAFGQGGDRKCSPPRSGFGAGAELVVWGSLVGLFSGVAGWTASGSTSPCRATVRVWRGAEVPALASDAAAMAREGSGVPAGLSPAAGSRSPPVGPVTWLGTGTARLGPRSSGGTGAWQPGGGAAAAAAAVGCASRHGEAHSALWFLSPVSR